MPPRTPLCFRRVLFALFIFRASLAWSAATAPDWLIATPDETARAEAPLSIEIVRPTTSTAWPESFSLRLSSGHATRLIRLTPSTEMATATTDGLRRAYRGVLPADISGLTRVELATPASNRLALVITAPAPTTVAAASAAARDAVAAPIPSAVATTESAARAANPATEDATASTDDARASTAALVATDNFVFSPHEPMYFVVGSRGGANARFQLSFKYQMFDPQSHLAQWLPPLGSLYFGYTQTSLWDLAGDSKPFRDTSYRPSFFWQMQPAGDGWLPMQVRMGYEHESNGRDGVESRSIDTLFIRPVWRREFAAGEALSFTPKFYAYLAKPDNRDIQRYRGYVDWALRYGHEDGWLLMAMFRRGTMGKGSAQLDLSMPFRTPVFTRIGGFLNFQVFSGYGEDLLGYNVKSAPQFRIGVSLVR